MFRIGIGEDTHRLAAGRKLILGGVEIPFELGLLGHSDADALAHAVIDALLGACALGDIGQHFPDSDEAFRGISSLLLAKEAAARIRAAGFEIVNIDSVITAQKPKLAPFREAMRANLAKAFGVPPENISVKFTTPEGTGPEGNLECITVRAVAAVASIDLKKEEKGLVDFCKRLSVPFLTYTAEELGKAEGSFAVSAFVEKVTGVSCVCERSAVVAAKGSLLCHKKVFDGVTVAVARKNQIITFNRSK